MTQTYSNTEVKRWLADNLPTWQIRHSYLVRVYKTGSWRLSLMVANAIGYVAEAADHHPELIVNYPSVEVHLETHSAGGITAKDYELARKIEEIITWLPGGNDALTGAAEEQWLRPN